MAKVSGVNEVLKALRKLEGQFQSRKGQAGIGTNVIVGYTQSYAIYVHENLSAQHKVGQAKFLEQPARELANELGQIVHEVVAKGKTLIQGLLLAGLRLQRESQKLCPVETGTLKNSAFTRIE